MSRRQPRRQSTPAGNTLFIPDPHAPYHHRGMFRFLREVKAEFDPSRVVFLGDVIDGLTASRYSPQAAAKGADDEFKAACDTIRRLAAMFPLADVVAGNHDLRVEKKASEHGIPAVRIRPLNEVPDLIEPLRSWRWHEKLKLNRSTLATHGDGLGGANPGEAAVLQHRCNVVMGHLHTRFGVTYFSRGDWRNWAMNCGCLVDANSPAANYAKHHVKRPIYGVGLLLRGEIPLTIPM